MQTGAEHVREVEQIEAVGLLQQVDDCDAAPRQAVAKELLRRHLVRAGREAAHKLHGAPEAVEFGGGLHGDHATVTAARWRPLVANGAQDVVPGGRV